MEASEAVVRRCIDTFNKGTLEWLDSFYASDVEWIELPRTGQPSGRRGNRADRRACARSDDALCPDRRMRVIGCVAQGERVALELDWEGTTARVAGSLAEGTKIRMRIASFFTVADGLIARQVDYCTFAGA